MGVDIYGSNPKTKEGEYFRSNWWFWRPIVTLMEHADPDLCENVLLGTNDGDGFDTEGCDRMVAALEKMDWKEKIYLQQALQEVMPDVPCDLCNGTGTRDDIPELSCCCNKCYGKGKVRPQECSYPYDIELTKEFINFLQNCGGFAIH